MFDWIAANWVWLLLGLGALWLVLGGRMGCGGMGRHGNDRQGTGGHGDHAGPGPRPGAGPRTGEPHAGHDQARDVEVSGGPGRRHRGC